MTKELQIMTEKEWQTLVVSLCRTLGYMTYHTHDSRRSNPGFPDLVIVGHGHVIFAELKTDKGRVRPKQMEWITELQHNGAEAYIWRPHNYDNIRGYLKNAR